MTIRYRLGLPLLALLMAVPVHAQVVAGAGNGYGWAAWYGCWSPVGAAQAEAEMVCMLPTADPQTVRLLTVLESDIVDDTTIGAAGSERPLAEGGCEGVEVAVRSRDGQRIFIRADLTCPGVDRESTGILGFVGPDEWVDAPTLTVGGQSAARVIRYRAVATGDIPIGIAGELPRGQDLALEAARLRASAPMGVDEIVEAAGLVSPPALDAFLAVQGTGFDLDARTLARLDDAGVAGSTIDVMVALTFPQALQVQAYGGRPTDSPPPTTVFADAFGFDCRRAMFGPSYRGMCPDAFGFGYRDWRYGYSGAGFGGYGYDRFGWQYGAPIVIVVRPDQEVPDAEPAPTFVPGRGFTRGGSSAGGATAQPRGATPAASSSGSSGGSSTQSSGSSGSSDTTPARTAVPRSSNP
jgi:hypothetical protein